VTGRVDRYCDAVDVESFAVRKRLDLCVVQHAMTEHPLALGARQVLLTSPGGVIAVRVGNDGFVDRAERIDVEVAGRAVESLV